MNNLVVTVLNTIGIQSYIFGSNRLRENIGASYLVKQVTDEWVQKILQKESNWNVFIKWKESPFLPHIQDGKHHAELIYAGGGNTVLLFQTIGYARQFTKKLSKKILKEAPSINLVVAHKEFDWDNPDYLLSQAINDLMEKEIVKQKQEYLSSSPLLGLAVTADCRSTRLVAVDDSSKYINVDVTDEGYLISREIREKLKAVDNANHYLKQTVFNDIPLKNYKIPLDFDDFGRSEGDSSYIAVVHADGNSMGKRFQKQIQGRQNEDYVMAIRKLSSDVDNAGKLALKSVVKKLIDSIDSQGKVMGEFQLANKDGIRYLPFRPLVYGGDDVTFVCDGRLGLELAASYLEEFEKQPVVGNTDGENPLTACAGVCVVKVHYPFARAYQFSEDLCKSAKKFIKEEGLKGANLSALDWHLASSGLIGSINEIRGREYYVPEGNLTMRPVIVGTHETEWRNWVAFKKIIDSFNKGTWKSHKNKDDKPIVLKRNKIIALREVLRRGSKATEEFLKTYQIANLPTYPDSSRDLDTLTTTGWLEKQCGYFDAIEAMEFYISLTEVEADE